MTTQEPQALSLHHGVIAPGTRFATYRVGMPGTVHAGTLTGGDRVEDDPTADLYGDRIVEVLWDGHATEQSVATAHLGLTCCRNGSASPYVTVSEPDFEAYLIKLITEGSRLVTVGECARYVVHRQRMVRALKGALEDYEVGSPEQSHINQVLKVVGLLD